MNANSQPLAGLMEEFGPLPVAPLAVPLARSHVTARVETDIERVEGIWRQLCGEVLDSPGQSYDFIRLWTRNRNLPGSAQRYVVGEVDGRPVALLPLHLKRVWGIKVLTWFPGANAGCYAPIADRAELAALGASGRAALWRTMIASLSGASLLYLRSVPVGSREDAGLFDELGTALQTEILYRAQFSSWEQCDAEQRSRSRRKHDRQQGDRLAALGTVGFEEIADPALAHPVIDLMFRQRSDRFRAQGIRDCFVADNLIGFYHEAIEPKSGLDVRLHVLRLDSEIVAVRYNIVHGDRMFCLISSMSASERIQSGSPGKQCLLRVMQSVFGQGLRVFDMGAGFTDEKRHWCNVQVPLRHHYVSLTLFGAAIAQPHCALQRLRMWAKANPVVRNGLRGLRQLYDRGGARTGSDQL